MKLSRLLHEDRVVMEVAASTPADLIAHTLDALPEETFEGTDRETVKSILIEREAGGSLVIEGLMIPHARLEGLRHPFMAVGVPVEPFEAPVLFERDKTATVQLAMLVCVARTQNTLMLQTTAAIQRLLREESVATLRAIKSPAKFIRHVEDTGIDIKKILIAGDIMVSEDVVVHPGDSLGQAVRALVASRSESIPVLDDRGALVGELRSADVLNVGIPSHLKLLSDTSLLDQFEAFEQYFEKEMALTVEQVMSRKIHVVNAHESVMSVALMLLRETAAKVYVVHRQGLQGSIRPRDVVLRVLGV